MSHDAFISYSTRDEAAANAICGALEARGITCWIAPRDIAFGANYATAIVEAIAAAKVLVLVFSAHANASRSVLNEVERAFSRDCAILPIRLDATGASGGLEFFLSLLQWFNAYPRPLGSYLDDFATRVGGVLAARTSGTAPPPRPPDPSLRPAPAGVPSSSAERRSRTLRRLFGWSRHSILNWTRVALATFGMATLGFWLSGAGALRAASPPQIDAAISETAPSVADVRSGLVQIFAIATANAKPQSAVMGTGFVINDSGYVATTRHVIADVLAPGRGTIWVVPDSLPRGAGSNATPVWESAALDLAVLRTVNLRGATALRLTTAVPQPGDQVLAAGYPSQTLFGDDDRPSTTITNGVYSRRVRITTQAAASDVIQHSALISLGEGGSPLLDACHRVIGINTQVQTTGDNGNAGASITYAAAVSELLAALRQHAIPVAPVSTVPCTAGALPAPVRLPMPALGVAHPLTTLVVPVLGLLLLLAALVAPLLFGRRAE